MEITADEVHLRLVTNAELPFDRGFQLVVTDETGKTLTIVLDGLLVADLLGDAEDSGMPTAAEFRAKGVLPRERK